MKTQTSGNYFIQKNGFRSGKLEPKCIIWENTEWGSRREVENAKLIEVRKYKEVGR